jgi:hypothetical protein
MSSTSTSSGSSQSTSTGGGSFIPNYPQSPLLMEISQYARSLAPQMLQWGKEQYDKNASITDDMLNEANIYASPSRINADMGMAESGVEQSMDKARENSIRDLQSYGIDPSSGRYAALDKAERGKAAAAAAGAGNQQRLATEATGRALRSEALNAKLANTSIGANLMRLPNDYLQTASNLKYPPLGTNPQNSQSTSQNQSRGQTIDQPQSGGSGAGRQPSQQAGRTSNGGSGGGSGGGGNVTVNTGGGGGDDEKKKKQAAVVGPYNGPNAYQGAVIHPVPPYPDSQQPGSEWGQDFYDPYNSYGPGSADLDPGNQYFDPWSAYDANNTGGNSYNQFNPGDQYFDPYSAYPGAGADGSQNYWGGVDQQYSDNSQDTSGDWGGNQQSYDWSNVSTPDTSGYGDNSAWAGSSGGDTYDTSGDYSDYAQGGAVGGRPAPGATTGGFVSKQLSPSGGQQVDDVPANLNADEFVVPRDVALWKGQEFFQKLIEQSRKARLTAPAHPTVDDSGEQNAARGGAMIPGMYQNFQRRIRPTQAQGATPFDATMPGASNRGLAGLGIGGGGGGSAGSFSRYGSAPTNAGGLHTLSDQSTTNYGYQPPRGMIAG